MAHTTADATTAPLDLEAMSTETLASLPCRDEPARRDNLRDLSRDHAAIDPACYEAIRRVTCGDAPWPLTLTSKRPGSGKTCAALCVLDWTYGTAKYETLKGLNNKLAAAYGERGINDWGESGLNPVQWWSHWRDAACVCLDEIGVRPDPSGAEYDVLKQAIDDRHGKPAIFITNVPVGDLTDLYDNRIVSRLAEGTIVEFPDIDRRINMNGWPVIYSELCARWPKWEPTEVEQSDWRRALGDRNAKWLREAMFRVKAKFASDEPKLKHITDELRKIRDEKSIGDPERPVEPVAVREARERNEVGQDRARCLTQLRSLDPMDVARARKYVNEKYQKWFGTMITERDMSKWSLGAMRFVLDTLGFGTEYNGGVRVIEEMATQ